jgi:hypothetical protein
LISICGSLPPYTSLPAISTSSWKPCPCPKTPFFWTWEPEAELPRC